MPRFYHFTCEHGYQGLGSVGSIRPNWVPWLGVALVWFTDDPNVSRDAVGLTSETGLISCDRMAYCYEVRDAEAHLKIKPWLGSPEQAQTSPHIQADLHRFSEPRHWWISRQPVLAQLVTP